MRVPQFFVAASLCLVTAAVFAGDYKTVVFTSADSPLTIKVSADGFVLLRNFTQVDGTTRGIVSVSNGTGNASVLAASIVDPAAAVEVINSIVIGGPAIVNATCPADATSCTLTYRKSGGN